MIKHDATDLHSVAQTILGEARSEPINGQLGVAFVIANRCADDRWPARPRDVAVQDRQFSAWNLSTENVGNLRIMALTHWESDQYQLARAAAGVALTGLRDDPTDGANHYHHESITPSWTDADAVTAHIGRHVFYRL